MFYFYNFHFCCCSITQSCPTLCNPTDCRKSRLPCPSPSPKAAQAHVHWVRDAIQPSHPLSSPYLLTFNLSQHQGLLKWVSSSHQVAKVLEFQLQRQSFQSTPRTAARQASLSITNSQSSPKLMSIELVMPSNHLILCRPLFLPSIFPRIRVFSNESALRIRWPK